MERGRLLLLFIFLFFISIGFSETIKINPFTTKRVNAFEISTTQIAATINNSEITLYYYMKTPTPLVDNFYKSINKNRFYFTGNIQFKDYAIYRIENKYNVANELGGYDTYYDITNEKTNFNGKTEWVLAIKTAFPAYGAFGFTADFGAQELDFDPEISSCGTITTPGVYELTNNVTATGTCFDIQHVNITLDCKGYTINFASSPSSSSYGIVTYPYVNNTIIRNCNIVSDNKTSGSVSTPSIGIQVSSNYFTLQNTNITIDNGEYAFPIRVSSANFTSITAVVINSTNTDRVFGGIRLQYANNVVVTNATISQNQTVIQGSPANIYATDSSNITASNVISYTYRGNDVNFENNVGAIGFVNVNNTNISELTHYGFNNSRSVTSIRTGGFNQIFDKLFINTNTNGSLIRVFSGNNIQFINSVFNINFSEGIILNNSNNVQIRNNVVRQSSTRNLIQTFGGASITINANNFSTTNTKLSAGNAWGRSAVSILSGSNISVYNNSFNDNGVCVDYCVYDNVTVALNSTIGNYYYNITSYRIYDSNNDTIGDIGEDYPVNSTIGLIYGNSVDYRPITPKKLVIAYPQILSPIAATYQKNSIINITIYDNSSFKPYYDVSVFFYNDTLFSVVAVYNQSTNYTFNVSNTSNFFYVEVTAYHFNGSILTNRSEYYSTFDTSTIKIDKMWNTYPSNDKLFLRASVNFSTYLTNYKIYISRCNAEEELVDEWSGITMSGLIEKDLDLSIYKLFYECPNTWVLHVTSVGNTTYKQEYINLPPEATKSGVTNDSIYMAILILMLLYIRHYMIRSWGKVVLDFILILMSSFIFLLVANSLNVSGFLSLATTFSSIMSIFLTIIIVPFTVFAPLLVLLMIASSFYKPLRQFWFLNDDYNHITSFRNLLNKLYKGGDKDAPKSK